ncbi:hypothetical protein BDZ97DRAFT_1377313 [Flammula alnicola]|nr:hypothetical protein BDZ97DRAFT_1377313 [Flammula alnicola]
MPVVPPAMLPCPKSILVQCRAVSLDGKNLERSPDLPLTETQTYQNLTRPPFDSQPFQFSSYSPRVLDRIPTEIWQRIFIFSLSSEQVPVLEEIFGPIWGRVCPPSSSSRASLLPSMPSTLSQVCWRWRDVAFGMPELWNILSVKVPRTNTDIDGTRKLRNIGHLIKSRLARSATLPLKICIIAKDDVEGSRSLIRAFLPFSYQWETLHLQTPFKALSELVRLWPEDVPILRSVRTYEQAYAPG